MSHVTPTTPKGRKARQRAIGRNIADLDTTAMRENIRAVYHAAGDFGSRSWYADAHAHAVDLSRTQGVPLRTAIGVIAALSPSTAWERNLSLAETMLETGDAAHAYGDAIVKARRINDGESPHNVLGGRKVRSFYRNLLHPAKPGAVTIDRHALSIALLGVQGPSRSTRTRTLSGADLKTLDRPGVYAMVAGVYRSVARELSIAPHDLQSITWDYWRAEHAYGTTTNVEAF